MNIECKTIGYTTIELMDLSGKTVYRNAMNGNNIKVDLSNLAKGTYMLRLTSGNTVGNKIVVLQ